MKNFLNALSEIGGQIPKPLDIKVGSGLKPEPEKVEVSYDPKKEMKDLKNFFLSFEDQKRYLILFSLPVYFN